MEPEVIPSNFVSLLGRKLYVCLHLVKSSSFALIRVLQKQKVPFVNPSQFRLFHRESRESQLVGKHSGSVSDILI